MGFNCLTCGKREVWAFESPTHPKHCWDCHRKLWPETKEMRKHREYHEQMVGVPITKN